MRSRIAGRLPRPAASLSDGSPDNPATDANKLKLALWYISKFDSLEEAERVFRAASAATKELSTRK